MVIQVFVDMGESSYAADIGVVEGSVTSVYYFKVHNFLGVFIAAILEGRFLASTYSRVKDLLAGAPRYLLRAYYVIFEAIR